MKRKSNEHILQIITLLLVPYASEAKKHEKIELCEYYEGSLHCHNELPEKTENILPDDSCVIRDCRDCLRAWRSAIYTEKELVKIDTFILIPNNTMPGKSKIYECENQGFPCECNNDKPCKGSNAVCTRLPCTGEAACTCRIREVADALWHENDSGRSPNPLIISFEYCAAEFPSHRSRRSTRHRRRHLLEDENAVFTLDDVTVTFSDPVFSVTTTGSLIIRIHGLERIYQLKAQNLQAVVPEEFLRDEGQLHFIFVTTAGETVRGDIHIDGRTECRRIPCIFCADLFHHMRCLPPALSYTVYSGCIILCAITVLCIRKALFAFTAVISGIWHIGVQVFRAIRGTTRLSLVGGAALGRSIRRRAEQTRIYLERLGAPAEVAIPLVLLMICIAVTEVQASCNNHIILASHAKNCENGLEEETCETSTQLQITLENLKYEQCVWLTDEHKNNLFSLAIKLNLVECQWDTRREYFTFPTKMEVLRFVACPQNEWCAYGLHCIEGKSFPTETQESKDFPGVNRCLPLDSGSSQCVIIDSQACLFLRAYLIPDHLRTYEVRTINGYHCTYQLEVKEGNITSDISVLHNHATSPSGIRMKVLGAYDQPNQQNNYHLISRVGDPSEAYLDSAAPAGIPKPEFIGDVQANQSLTKAFIFSDSMIRCSTYEEELKCSKPKSYLETITESKRSALPRAIGYHFFKIDAQGTLKSELLFTSPVTVHLEFEKYRFHIERRTVCPKFERKEIKAEGCYACEPLAKLTFFAHSTCAEGYVQVNFERIGIATRSVRLSTKTEMHIVEFRVHTRCTEDKLCLQGRTVHACIPISFCLKPAHIELTHPNMTYVHVYSGHMGGSVLGQWASILPWTGLSSIWKSLGFTALGALTAVFIFSTIITCLKK